MKVILYFFEPDGEMWNITGLAGQIRRLNNDDNYVQLNMAEGRKKIFPMSNIAYIDILEKEVIIE